MQSGPSIEISSVCLCVPPTWRRIEVHSEWFLKIEFRATPPSGWRSWDSTDGHARSQGQVDNANRKEQALYETVKAQTAEAEAESDAAKCAITKDKAERDSARATPLMYKLPS